MEGWALGEALQKRCFSAGPWKLVGLYQDARRASHTKGTGMLRNRTERVCLVWLKNEELELEKNR